MPIDPRSLPLAAPAPRPTVLVADADADTRALYRAIFPPHEYDVVECDDGAEALGLALARRPDLVITETHLTRIDGFELCRLLRGDPMTRTMPIVVVTTSAGSGDHARAMQAGATCVLVKPCAPEAVVAAATRVLDELQLQGEGAALPASDPHAAAPAAPQVFKPRRRSRGFQRHVTTTPPSEPPDLRCPRCDQGLVYGHSHIGGVNAEASEQWDYFACRHCGNFQYRHRTRKLKAIAP